MIDERLHSIVLGCEMGSEEAISQIKALVVESLGEERKLEYTCMCDCLPCKTDSCSSCNLGETSSPLYENGDLCKESDNADWSEPYNQHIAEMKEKFK